ncbi:MAG: hypothetical protein BWX99_02909 [Deltaproteobacteria bacterium ADurb.Bin151]|nr:MAG: hypothetical protein BWX99_02909 [Deltaproteobacteria bacterium ADurb.Bin151]
MIRFLVFSPSASRIPVLNPTSILFAMIYPDISDIFDPSSTKQTVRLYPKGCKKATYKNESLLEHKYHSARYKKVLAIYSEKN